MGGEYGTALAAAAAFGKSVNIMSLPVLLDRGADICYGAKVTEVTKPR